MSPTDTTRTDQPAGQDDADLDRGIAHATERMEAIKAKTADPLTPTQEVERAVRLVHDAEPYPVGGFYGTPYSAVDEDTARSLAQRLEEAQRERADPNGLWVVWYEDADAKPEVFFGEGAEQAARAKYAQAQTNWSCHLLSRVPDQPPNASDAALQEQGGEPEPELWRCENCGKEFDKATFSHARAGDDGHGNPVPVECGPISKVEAERAADPLTPTQEVVQQAFETPLYNNSPIPGQMLNVVPRSFALSLAQRLESANRNELHAAQQVIEWMQIATDERRAKESAERRIEELQRALKS